MARLLKLRSIVRALRREHIFFIAPLTLCVILVSSVGVYYFENGDEVSTIHSVWDGIWWAFVTICTVGYGDKVPVTNAGKVIGIFLMISGIGLLSMLTAAIASVLVEQKMKEGRGLDTIKEKGHVVVCGWNNHTEEVIQGLLSRGSQGLPSVVLINELPVDEIDALKARYTGRPIRFLRGDFVHEEVLLRANIDKAEAALVMVDLSGNHPRERADDRTILAALAIKSLAPKIKTVAELLDGENRAHLKRANVDEIVVRGEHIGSLLASAIQSPGLNRFFSGLVSLEGSGTLKKEDIPGQFVGKSFGELSAYYRDRHKAILVGFLQETKGIRVEDLLTEDASAIDLFLMEKLKESRVDLLQREDAVKVVINPDSRYVINVNDRAVLVAASRVRQP